MFCFIEYFILKDSIDMLSQVKRKENKPIFVTKHYQMKKANSSFYCRFLKKKEKFINCTNQTIIL